MLRSCCPACILRILRVPRSAMHGESAFMLRSCCPACILRILRVPRSATEFNHLIIHSASFSNAFLEPCCHTIGLKKS